MKLVTNASECGTNTNPLPQFQWTLLAVTLHVAWVQWTWPVRRLPQDRPDRRQWRGDNSHISPSGQTAVINWALYAEWSVNEFTENLFRFIHRAHIRRDNKNDDKWEP